MQPLPIQKRHLINLATLSVVFALSGCASLSEKSCRKEDWQAIGMRDGSNGYTEYRISDHQDACAKYNIVPDSHTYEAGRQRGLMRYCTISGGLRAGRSGGSYAGLCSGETEAAFLSAYQLGLELNRVEARLDAVRSERSSVYFRLRELDRVRNNDRTRQRDDRRDETDRANNQHHREREQLLYSLNELEREEWRLDNDVRQLEWEARRLK